MSSLSAETCIAILCTSSSIHQVRNLISHVTKQPVSNDQETFPWSIDNKYYTADVEFRIFDLGEPPSRAIVGRITDKNAVSENTPVDEEDDLPTDDDQADVFRWQDCPALVYVLPSPADSSTSFSTPSFSSLTSEINLAILLPSALTSASKTSSSGNNSNDLEDEWDERGFEFLDLSRWEAGAEEGQGKGVDRDGKMVEGVRGGDVDEEDRVPDPFFRFQESLQTIVWPNMVRKPLPKTKHHLQQPELSNKNIVPSSESPSSKDPSTPVSFPVGFSGLEIGPGKGKQSGNLSETVVNEEEFEKLDAWLKEEEEEDPTSEKAEDFKPHDDSDGKGKRREVYSNKDQSDGKAEGNNKKMATDKFEDDFSDFVIAPSGSKEPISSTTTTTTIPPSNSTIPDHHLDSLLDPSQLLSHLSSLRSQLSQLENEDERRLRAGEEVEKVLRMMGLDGGMGLDEMGGFEGMGFAAEVEEEGQGVD